MGKFTAGDVVLVTFPFSNFQRKKIRPALVLAQAEFDNVILCQITSKTYSSKKVINLETSDFEEGNLPVKSFIRVDKLFTADTSILQGKAGVLTKLKTKSVLKKVRDLFA